MMFFFGPFGISGMSQSRFVAINQHFQKIDSKCTEHGLRKKDVFLLVFFFFLAKTELVERENGVDFFCALFFFLIQKAKRRRRHRRRRWRRRRTGAPTATKFLPRAETTWNSLEQPGTVWNSLELERLKRSALRSTPKTFPFFYFFLVCQRWSPWNPKKKNHLDVETFDGTH